MSEKKVDEGDRQQPLLLDMMDRRSGGEGAGDPSMTTRNGMHGVASDDDAPAASTTAAAAGVVVRSYGTSSTGDDDGGSDEEMKDPSTAAAVAVALSIAGPNASTTTTTSTNRLDRRVVAAAGAEPLSPSFSSDAAAGASFPPQFYDVPIKFDQGGQQPPPSRKGFVDVPPLPPDMPSQEPWQVAVNWSSSFPSYSDDSSGMPQPVLPQPHHSYYAADDGQGAPFNYDYSHANHPQAYYYASTASNERQHVYIHAVPSPQPLPPTHHPQHSQEVLSEEELRLRLLLWQERAQQWDSKSLTQPQYVDAEAGYYVTEAASADPAPTIRYDEEATALSLTDLDRAFSEAVSSMAAPLSGTSEEYGGREHPLKRPTELMSVSTDLPLLTQPRSARSATGTSTVVTIPAAPAIISGSSRRPPTHGHGPHYHHQPQQHQHHRRAASDNVPTTRGRSRTPQLSPNHPYTQGRSQHATLPGASQRMSPRKAQQQLLPNQPSNFHYPQQQPVLHSSRRERRPPSWDAAAAEAAATATASTPLRSTHRSGSWSNLTLAYNTINPSNDGRHDPYAWRKGGGTISMPTTPTQGLSKKTAPSLGAFLKQHQGGPQQQQRPHHRRTSSYASSTGANSVATDKSQVSYVADIRQSEYFSHYTQSGKAQLNFPSSRVHLFMNQYDEEEAPEESNRYSAHHHHYTANHRVAAAHYVPVMGDASEHSLLLPPPPPSDRWSPNNQSPPQDRASSPSRSGRSHRHQPPRFRNHQHPHQQPPPTQKLPEGKLYQVAIPAQAYENYHLEWEDVDDDLDDDDDLLLLGLGDTKIKCRCPCPQCKKAHGGHHVQLPPCYYAMAVPDDLYRRVLDEIVLSRQMPCRLFFCGQYEDVDRPSIGIAAVIVFGLLVLMGTAAYLLQS